MDTVYGRARQSAAMGAAGMVILAALSTSFVSPEARAGWPWKGRHHAACGHEGCSADRCLESSAWAGEWHWLRSPDQEQRVIMSRYNRYCIRCHGIDGRGVWDIPDVPDFTDRRWQASRTDWQIVNIVMEGRGAVMPTFRGTLTLEESWAMAHYLRSFVPGNEATRSRSAVPPPRARRPLSPSGPVRPPRPERQRNSLHSPSNSRPFLRADGSQE